jgi:hypothetical protein
MNSELFKDTAVKTITDFAGTFKLHENFKVTFGEIFDEEADIISGSVNIEFKYKNCQKKHTIHLGWNEVSGFGLEEIDGEIQPINDHVLLRLMYFDLALSDLDEKYIN